MALSYRLIRFRTALVTCVCGDHHHGFHFSAACHYAPHCHQLADVFCFDISDWNWFVQAHILEIDFTAITTDSNMKQMTSHFYCYLKLSMFYAVRQVTVHIPATAV